MSLDMDRIVIDIDVYLKSDTPHVITADTTHIVVTRSDWQLRKSDIVKLFANSAAEQIDMMISGENR